jgi:hypothetical protein
MKGEVIMAEESAASGAMWALVTVLLVILVVAVLYLSGIFTRSQKKEIDINIGKPGIVLSVGSMR